MIVEDSPSAVVRVTGLVRCALFTHQGQTSPNKHSGPVRDKPVPEKHLFICTFSPQAARASTGAADFTRAYIQVELCVWEKQRVFSSPDVSCGTQLRFSVLSAHMFRSYWP